MVYILYLRSILVLIIGPNYWSSLGLKLVSLSPSGSLEYSLWRATGGGSVVKGSAGDMRVKGGYQAYSALSISPPFFSVPLITASQYPRFPRGYLA